MEELLRVEDLTKVIDYHIIFKQLNFSLQSGKIVGLLGSNGRGKTTLLHLITGFCYPSNGKVTVDRSSISYFVEADDFYRWMRVKDALEYYEVYFEDFDRARAEQLMKEAGIDRGMKLRKLSSGMQDKVSFILAISRRVKLYLFDEPLAGSDIPFKSDLKKMLLANIPEDATVLIATHMLKDFETLFDEVLILNAGGIEQIETERIREEYKMSVEEYFRVQTIFDVQNDGEEDEWEE